MLFGLTAPRCRAARSLLLSADSTPLHMHSQEHEVERGHTGEEAVYSVEWRLPALAAARRNSAIHVGLASETRDDDNRTEPSEPIL
jgi:hypothetical protein